MCLNITDNKRRGKDSAIRWKFLNRFNSYLISPAYISGGYTWNINKINKSKCNRKADIEDKEQSGFHVFMTREDALVGIGVWQNCSTRNLQLVKLKVDGFKAKGEISNSGYGIEGFRGEIWRRAKILAVYDRITGKDITNQFKNTKT